ncbi:Membrane dipeptidase (Peptidase family M19) [Anatilimnocola aggregata]|uniref:Membrane dipeptidase (Peptidase family M19) n=1 Tax=Anatilimnocola aggregata TaxID=2528021 RepID=A0A517YJ06_9BACT|nr:dipeptidase [Anatilimnocola aggregata]QDU30210.1 Membrane dipeptidase (Peptidase family M19) [Anatilimnocola aggregata]
MLAAHASRRDFLRAAVVVAAANLTCNLVIAQESAKRERKKVVLTDEGRRVHAAGFVFDGHNDLPWEMRKEASSSFDKRDIAQPQPKMHTDIARLKQGNVGAQFWSVYVPAETAQAGTALQQTMEQIDLVEAMIKRYPETFAAAVTVADIEAARKAGKIASLIGVEGGHCIEDSLENLRRLKKRGAGYLTLTHSDTLQWADAATDTAKHEGLTPFGEEVVRELNKLGMLVDLSHVSDATMRDALRVSKAPVIYSHSSARSIANHPRNVPDDVLKLVKANGGVVMVNFFSGFVVPESAEILSNMFAVSRELRAKFPNEADYTRESVRWEKRNPYPVGDIHDVVDHIEHIAKVACKESVGLGSDYDGISKCPMQLEDVSTYPLITQELLNRGWQPAEIHGLMSGNVLRVMKKAEEVAAAMTQE